MPVNAVHVPGASETRVEVDPMEEAFLDWIRLPEHTNRRRLTLEQRREYAAFLRDPKRPCKGQADQNNRTKALQKFCLDSKGQLCRKPVENPSPDESSNTTIVIMGEEAYKRIAEMHRRLSHAGRDKTWLAIKDNYWSITKEEVSWVLANCRHCNLQARSLAQPPLTPIKSIQPNERVQVDLIDYRSQPSSEYKWVMHMKVCLLSSILCFMFQIYSLLLFLCVLLNCFAASLLEGLVSFLTLRSLATVSLSSPWSLYN